MSQFWHTHCYLLELNEPVDNVNRVLATVRGDLRLKTMAELESERNLSPACPTAGRGHVNRVVDRGMGITGPDGRILGQKSVRRW